MRLGYQNVAEIAAMTRPFVFAWHFLTAIPISRTHHEPSSAELATSMAWYSTVGLLIGGFLAAADQGLRLFLAAEVVNVLLIVLLVLMTRGLHQDGLADTLDGLAGGRTAAVELLINTPRMADLIIKGDLSALRMGLAAENQDGIRTFDKSVYRLFKRGLISLEEAREWSSFGRVYGRKLPCALHVDTGINRLNDQTLVRIFDEEWRRVIR